MPPSPTNPGNEQESENLAAAFARLQDKLEEMGAPYTPGRRMSGN